MNIETTPQRRVAAADLSERGAALLREDVGFAVADEVYLCAMDVLSGLDPEDRYRDGLKLCRVSGKDVEEAVAAIAAGKHPPDSLPGWLELEMRSCSSDPETHLVNRLMHQIGGVTS